jgi:HK97 family phage portal protein
MTLALPRPAILETFRAGVAGVAGLARRALSIRPGQNMGFSLVAPVLSGVTVTPQTALTLTSWYAGVNVISTDVAKLPFQLCRREGDAYVPVTGDPRNRLVGKKPNGRMNAMRYRQMAMGHVLGWGNHYSEIERGDDGMPTALIPLHPGQVKPMATDSGDLFYRNENTGARYLPENIVHVAGLGFDGIKGYCAVTLMRQAIGLGIGAEQFGASLFGNGAVPKGILRTPKRLSDQGAKHLREDFDRVHSGSQNANRVAVLEEGLEWINTQINPDDAQFLGTRGFQVLEIARMLNLPPHKLGDYSQAHLANIEESNADYLISTLQGWLTAIEAEYDDKLLFDDEQELFTYRHDMSALLRGNMTGRATFYQVLKGIGAINADTVAAREGLPIPGPANGGNLYLVQSQNIPAQNAGKTPPPAPPPPSPADRGES